MAGAATGIDPHHDTFTVGIVDHNVPSSPRRSSRTGAPVTSRRLSFSLDGFTKGIRCSGSVVTACAEVSWRGDLDGS